MLAMNGARSEEGFAQRERERERGGRRNDQLRSGITMSNVKIGLDRRSGILSPARGR
jgi:hypothetical protein